MKLKVIGSGNIFSKCNSASYLIDDEILIDVPNGTCKILKNMGVKISKINHIIITHFHGDHFFDIPFVLLNKIVDNANECNLYCDNTAECKIYDVTKLAFPNKAEKIKDYFKYIHDNKFYINDYIVEKTLVEHGEGLQAYGYIFYKDNQCIGFTGDSGFCENIEEMAKKCNHLICDCNAIEGKKSHMGINNITELANKYPNCIFYTTHMADTTREQLRELGIKNVVVLKDGDEFTF